MDLEEILKGTPYGKWTEQLAREASARGGQPDFVYRGVEVRRGGGTREVGDHLVLMGHKLAIVSVKSRDIRRRGLDDEVRTRSWLDKNIAQAARQIAGTRRTLFSGRNHGIALLSDRGVSVPWTPGRVTEVYGVIVINYSAPDDYIAATAGEACVLPMETWTDLNEALATGGIFNYLAWRRLRTVPLPMVLERELLGEQLIQEARSLPVLDPNVTPRADAWDTWTDRYPETVRTLQPGHHWGRIVDAVIAAAHDQDPQFGQLRSQFDYLDIIEVLECLHPESKIDLGKKMLEKCRLAYEQDRERYFAFDDGDGGMIVFVSDPAEREERRKLLQLLVFAIHSLTIEQGDNTAHRTIGLATEPYPWSGRSHDIVLLKGKTALTAAERTERDELLAGMIGAPRPVDEAVLDRLDAPKP